MQTQDSELTLKTQNNSGLKSSHLTEHKGEDMRGGPWVTSSAVALLVGLAWTSAGVGAQTTAGASSAARAQAAYTPPRTPWGDPDLQGIWPGTEMVGVPFERPEPFGTPMLIVYRRLGPSQKKCQ